MVEYFDRGIGALEKLADRFAAWRLLVIACFTVIYAVPTARLATQKLFWDDELFTLYLSRLPSWNELSRALATGADQHPPTFFYLTRGVIELFGCSPLTVRLPEICGFWLLCVSLYAIGRRLVGPVWGALAMMFPLTTGAYYFATEARGYSLSLGFSALALYAWIEITENRKRKLFLPVLAISVAAVVASHYYGVLGVLALCAGEALRSLVRKKFELATWAALACAAAPLIVFVQSIAKGAQYSANFWAVPAWSDVFSFYPHNLLFGVNIFAGALGCLVLLNSTFAESAKQTFPTLRSWIAAALLAFGLIPFIAMVLGKFITHAFTDRYALAALIGLSLLLSYSLFVLYRQRSIGAVVSIAICGLCFVVNQHEMKSANRQTLDDLRASKRLLSAKSNGAIAISEPTLFHRLSFYVQPDLRARINFLLDQRASVEHLHNDTADIELAALRPWFPLHLAPFADFIQTHPGFFVYGSGGWLIYELPKISADPKLVAKEGVNSLFFVQTAPTLTGNAAIQSNQATSANADLAPQSLCAFYFGADHCPAL